MNKLAILICGVGGTGKSTTATYLEKCLKKKNYNTKLIRFDEFRKSLAPLGVDPFSKDSAVKNIIYKRAAEEFSNFLDEGLSLIIDSGLSNENIRKKFLISVGSLKIVHLYCPLFVAIYRDTFRSIRGEKHERGSYLHMKAIFSLVNPFQKKFDQPGITYPFDYPECAHLHVNTFFKSPDEISREICQKLRI